MKYHAVMLDETRCEFGVDVEATSRDEAYQKLADMYAESSVVQLESPFDTANREKAMYDHISAGGDWDDEGRPIFHYSESDDDDEDGWDHEDDFDDSDYSED